MNSLQEHIQACLTTGFTDEDYAEMLLVRNYGGACYHSSRDDDMHRHIDFWWHCPNGNWYSFDVKGWYHDKHTRAILPSYHHWLEWQNVTGRKGWVLGEAHFIAFLTMDDLIIVNRDRLAALTGECVSLNGLTHDKPDVDYIPYQRRGRNDIIIRVPHSRLRAISYKRLKYE